MSTEAIILGMAASFLGGAVFALKVGYFYRFGEW